jgi:hypothetical protein
MVKLMPAFCPLGDKIMKASITLVVLLLGLSPAAAGGPLRRDVINLRDILIRMLAALGTIVAMASAAFADDILQYTGAGSTARALFPANDLLDWGQLGPQCPGANVVCLPSTVTATSNRGITITVTDTGGFARDDEQSIGWSGHFQLGDHLLTDGNNSQTTTITFTLNKLVAGIGLELGYDSGDFTATAQIFDDKGKVLSTITQPVISGACIPACNNAPFYGFYDPKGRIASFVITPSDIGNSLAWNQVSLIDEPALSFAGTPGEKNCRSRSEATLRGLYGGLTNAAAALGFTSTAALRNDIKEYCGE